MRAKNPYWLILITVMSVGTACKGHSDAQLSPAVREFTSVDFGSGTVARKADLSLTACLKRGGYSYEPPQFGTVPSTGGGSSFGYFYRMDTPDQKSYGYGTVVSTVNAAVLQSIITSRIRAQPPGFPEQLKSCQESSSKEARADADLMADQRLAARIVDYKITAARVRFESTGRAMSAVRKWSECLSKLGFKVKSPPDLQRQADQELNSKVWQIPVPTGLAQADAVNQMLADPAIVTLQKRELEYATAQSTCTQSSGLTELENDYTTLQNEEFSRADPEQLPGQPPEDQH